MVCSFIIFVDYLSQIINNMLLIRSELINVFIK